MTAPHPTPASNVMATDKATYSMIGRLLKWVCISMALVWLVIALVLWKSNQHELKEVSEALLGAGEYGEEVLHEMHELFASTLTTVLSGLVALALVLAVLLYFVVRRALQPLQDLSHSLQDPTLQMGQSVQEPEHIPRELQPIFQAITVYTQRMQEAMVREKNFIAHASHELKTPLAAILAHAENIGHPSRQSQEIEDVSASKASDSATQLMLSAQRLARLVEQLLTLAQVEQLHSAKSLAQLSSKGLPGPGIQLERLNLSELLREVLTDEIDAHALPYELDVRLGPCADSESAEESHAQGQDCWVWGNRHLLTLMLGNLIRNAFRYTPEKGHIGVYLAQDVKSKAQKITTLRIENDCLASPDSDWQQLGQRFFRGHMHTQVVADIAGSGLGLAICQEIAQALDLALQFGFHQRDTQFRVRVDFMAAPAQ